MKSLFTLLLILLGGLFAAAQDTTLIPRELFFQPKDIHRIKLAADGRRVYYQRFSQGEAKLLYRSADTAALEKQLTFEGPLLDWMPTHGGQLLVFLQTAGGQKRLWLADAQGRKLKDLTPFPLLELQLEALSRQFPDKAAVLIKARSVAQNGIYLIDMEQNAGERLSPLLGFARRFYDGDLRLVAAVRENAAGGRSIYIREGELWKPLIEYPFDEGMFIGGLQQVLSVSEDGQRLYYTDNHAKDKTVLLEYQLEADTQRILAADAKVDLLPYGAIVGANGWPQMVLGLWGQPRRHFLQGDTRRDFEWLDRQLAGQAGFVDQSADGRVWLVRRIDGGPLRYYLFRRGNRSLTPLFNDYPALDSFQLANRYTFTVRTRDSLELPVQLYLPPGTDKNHDGVPDTTLPTVLYVHGGPWAGVTHWNNWFHTRNFQLLANRGYAVLNVEFRGTTGLGKAMTRRGDRQWGEAMHHDLIDVANWAIRQRIADYQRLGVWGWSYGGYAAAAALTFAPERFACGLSMYGPADLDTFSRTAFTDNERWREVVGNPFTAEGSELLRRHSPYHHIDGITSPLLLTTGGQDERVPKAQVDAYAKALADGGKEVVYFYYPDEVHDFREPDSWISFWAIAEQFLQRYLGGRYQPPGDDLRRGNYHIVYGKEYGEAEE